MAKTHKVKITRRHEMQLVDVRTGERSLSVYLPGDVIELSEEQYSVWSAKRASPANTFNFEDVEDSSPVSTPDARREGKDEIPPPARRGLSAN